jgi:hypothetical protein
LKKLHSVEICSSPFRFFCSIQSTQDKYDVLKDLKERVRQAQETYEQERLLLQDLELAELQKLEQGLDESEPTFAGSKLGQSKADALYAADVATRTAILASKREQVKDALGIPIPESSKSARPVFAHSIHGRPGVTTGSPARGVPTSPLKQVRNNSSFCNTFPLK